MIKPIEYNPLQLLKCITEIISAFSAFVHLQTVEYMEH